jgi:hypothetical protein
LTTLFEKKENPTDYYSFQKKFAKWQKFNTKKKNRCLGDIKLGNEGFFFWSQFSDIATVAIIHKRN